MGPGMGRKMEKRHSGLGVCGRKWQSGENFSPDPFLRWIWQSDIATASYVNGSKKNIYKSCPALPDYLTIDQRIPTSLRNLNVQIVLI